MTESPNADNSEERTTGVIIGNIMGGIHNSIIAGRDVIIGTFVVSADAQRALRNRQAMLELVKNTWIKGVLENSLYSQGHIQLDMETHPEAIERPWEMVLRSVDQTDRQLPAGTEIIAVFDNSDGSLLILGVPGSGKTTMLLELTRETITRAEKDNAEPIPVVFDLSSWTEKRASLSAWLVDELNEKYLIPRRVGLSWVEDDCLLLLLDGLDEVSSEHRDDCVRTINDFRQDHLVPMVICSRKTEYEVLTTRLKVQNAVMLKPLTSQQIDHYLEEVGGDLNVVSTILDSDRTLYEMARSPLMLSILTLAYQGMSIEDIQTIDTTEARRKHILDTYQAQMFRRRPKDQPYTKSQSVHWLNCLANQMINHSQTVFSLETLQPSWLLARGWRWFYVTFTRVLPWLFFLPFFGLRATPALIIAGLVIGLAGIVQFDWRGTQRVGKGIPTALSMIVVGLAVCVSVGLIQGSFEVLTWTNTSEPVIELSLLSEHTVVANWWERMALDAGLSWGEISAIRSGVLMGFILGILAILFFWHRDSQRNLLNDIKTREALIWSRDDMRRSIKRWVLTGLGIGAIIGGVVGLLSYQILLSDYTRGGNDIEQAQSQALIAGYGTAMMAMFIVAFIFFFIGVIFAGIRDSPIAKKVSPNQGMHLTFRNAGFLGTGTCLIAAVVFKIIDLGYWLQWGYSIGLLTFLWYGGLDVIQHYILRLILWINGNTSFNYVRFLDYASERIFLRKVGGGYIFVHRLLMEHFAEGYQEP
jgi:hypothetical protein